MSGFWLTWHYFGFSPVFGTLVAVLQIGLGALLFFRGNGTGGRPGTAMTGAITVLGLCYGVDPGGVLASAFTFLALEFALWERRTRLVRLLWTENAVASGARPGVGKVLALVALLVPAAGGTYWVANENNRLPTPVDGSWRVVAGQYRPAGVAGPLDRVYFERERAFMVMPRFDDQ
ncbi:hypothetical protein LX15_005901 [Streptoalloteichus tenebrarius]|uniref:Uncharacterized protein n=1 Tax=Streptoalloteichus tenebrarius (strain ATCC 17920 / DSM 40477 / JCM 4838 / CBS 697.72 / NBRC 16177 / NCIMB 11028 / NRRL B-12390 / A12253. 1 / ISP 5477) TaxID=1933 RepID=A0ABT1I300_STRSD|nr:hypothetical protein [Streptoalloteichus tenebrarius]MCP2262167.1 hypothetical protein [Streptoalloteichus tenebrarius]BFF00030.1 hypothetical protein GCM10020241_17050 [Streptoalloteichus tenebrarius]